MISGSEVERSPWECSGRQSPNATSISPHLGAGFVALVFGLAGWGVEADVAHNGQAPSSLVDTRSQSPAMG